MIKRKKKRETKKEEIFKLERRLKEADKCLNKLLKLHHQPRLTKMYREWETLSLKLIDLFNCLYLNHNKNLLQSIKS